MKKHIFIMLVVSFLGAFFIFLYHSSNYSQNIEANEVKEDKKQLSVNQNIQKKDMLILKFAHNFPVSHPQHMALVEKFIPIVEKGSDWNIRVEVYPNSQLVEEKQYIQGVRQGTIEMCIAGQKLVDIVPMIKVLQFPYIFDSYDEAKRVLKGKVGQKITKDMESLGIYSLAWSLNGFGQIFIKNTESNKMKLATLSTQTGVDILKSMGFETLPIESEDMTMILNQKSVDGHDNPPLLSYYNDWYHNEGKIILTKHVMHPSMYMISSKFWDSLSDEYKALIKNAANESADYEIELLKAQEQEIFNTLKDKDIEIKSPNLEPYKNTASLLYEQWINEDNDLKDIFNEFKKSKLN